MLLVAYGLGERGIAHELGLDRKTVVKYYAHELEVGRAKIQAQVAEWLYSAASNGNVAAMKYLDAKGEGYVMGTSRTLGKKEQQLEAAKNAGGEEWGDLLKIEPTVKAN